MNKKLIGIILVLIGAVLLLIGIKGYQKQEELFHIKDIFSATTTTTKQVPALKYVGSGLIGAGVILIWLGFGKKRG